MSAQAMGCPNCGGPIEFKMGASVALICPHCRASVMRTDRDVRTLGIVADLVPSSPDINVGDRATLFGRGVFVGGRLQLDHGRGPWDEWYIETEGGRWAWLAKAQGHWYFSEPTQPTGSLPAWQHMSPGQSGQIPGLQGQWVVSERGESTMLSAEGELPHPTVPGERGRFVDLSGQDGGFATIDYGDGSGPPKLYAGRRLEQHEFGGVEGGITAMGAGVSPTRQEAQKLQCPTCGGHIEIRVPQTTERAACQYCSSLLDFNNGKLSLLQRYEQARLELDIPLGTEGTVQGEKVVVIGYMQRSTTIDYVTYRWREYLLHSETSGYLWLLEDNGHWIFIRPVDAGSVDYRRPTSKHDGTSFSLFATADAYVERVIGEFYWRVEQGERGLLEDYVKPPHVLSLERTDNEVNWTRGIHVDASELWKGLGLQTRPPPQTGVGLVQPNPHSLTSGCLGLGLALPLLIAASIFFASKHQASTLVDGNVQVPLMASAGPNTTGANAMLTPPFTLTNGPQVVAVTFSSGAANQYVGAPCALVNQATHEAITFYVDSERYSGVSGGESWSEGSPTKTFYVDGVPPGTYVLRVDPFWTGYPQPGGPVPMGPPAATIRIEQNNRSPWCFMLSLGLILFPFGLTLARHSAFETRRKELSNVG